ncbi:hypothetical protein AXW67_31235 [Bradyrhizobium neotropicale]|uniref:Uncharacterized protein n=1 Tax=Bradyrhizobium neotropicale TaxID=1497615 RepID=A0A176YK98_9BRAD|nr:hypothetical protein AXW67_31235 [Bradyrhizobium neotropicale]
MGRSNWLRLRFRDVCSVEGLIAMFDQSTAQASPSIASCAGSLSDARTYIRLLTIRLQHYAT